jgi:DNA-binding SARP family transcriptional activator
MSGLNIHLFGKFTVKSDTQVLPDFNPCKVQELFSYLLVHRNRPHSRETLAGVLWGDSTTEKSRKYLRQTLWLLHTAIENQHRSDIACMPLRVDHDWVQFDTSPTIWLDVALLEDAFTLVEGVAGHDIKPAQAASLQLAVDLYRGDLLEGWYQDWCLYERELLQNKYLMILDKLLGYCVSHHEYEAGQRYGAQILRHDRAHERTHRMLMRLQHMSGDRTGALRQYERCVSALREELDVDPDELTRDLYGEICGTDRARHTDSIDEVIADDDAVTTLPEVLGRLKHLQAMLGRMQRHVKRDIDEVELCLKPAETVGPPVVPPHLEKISN